MLIEFYKKLNKKFLLVAIFHTLFTFFNDKFAFKYYSLLDSKKIIAKALGYKFLLFIVLIIFWQYVPIIINKFKENKGNFRKKFYTFLAYFCFMMVFLLLSWPGVWRSDDVGVAIQSRYMEVYYWQHLLTSVYYTLSMMLIPFPAGVVIIQNLLISLILVDLWFNLYSYINKSNLAYIIYIPFVFLSVIDFNLCPIRASLLSYIALYVFEQLIFINLNKSIITKNKAIVLALLSAIAMLWRAECMIFIIMIPIIFFIATHHQKDKKVKRCYLISCLILLLLIYFPQSIGMENTHLKNRYQISGSIQQIGGIIIEKYDNPSEKDKECFEDINKIIDIEKMVNSGYSGIDAYFFADITRSSEIYTDEEFSKFRTASVKLILNNLPLFFEERIENFSITSAMTDITRINVGVAGKINGGSKEGYEQITTYYPLSKPIDKEFRYNFVRSIEGVNKDQSPNLIFRVFYNIIPSIILILFVGIMALIKRNYVWFLSCVAYFGQAFLVFLTSPDTFFMYYNPIYIAGFAFFIMWILMQRKNKNPEKL